MTATLKVVYTEYWSNGHRPYRNVLRSETDVDLGQVPSAIFEPLFAEAGVEDGDEIEIAVRKTGHRPFGNRRVLLVEPHTYRREKE